MKTTMLSLAVSVMLCGCICTSGLPAGQNGVVPNSVGEPSTLPPEQATTATVEPTTSTVAQADGSQVTVSVPVCSDDDYHNAMVAGYVTNNGRQMLPSVEITAKLENVDGSAVEGGLKTITVSDISPRESRKFAVTFEKPPKWVRCRAFVGGP